MKGLKWRFLLVVAVVVVSIIYLIPSVNPSLPSWWKGVLPREKLHLGLDLQGGMHLVLEVQTDEAVRSTADRFVDEIKDAFRKEKIPFFEVRRKGLCDLVVTFPKDVDLSNLHEVLRKEFPTLVEQNREITDKG